MPPGSTELYCLRNDISSHYRERLCNELISFHTTDVNDHLAIENTGISLRSFDVSELETWTLFLINNLYLCVFLLFLSSYYFAYNSQ